MSADREWAATAAMMAVLFAAGIEYRWRHNGPDSAWVLLCEFGLAFSAGALVWFALGCLRGKEGNDG